VADVVCEMIVSLDGLAHGERSPGYYGYAGPEFMAWIRSNSAAPHRMLVGRRTYEMLNSLPEEARDEEWRSMVSTPGWLFSRTLDSVEWPELQVVHDDAVEFVRETKGRAGSELRTLGSISLVQQLLSAGLVDCLKLVVCPLILPDTGTEPLFQNVPYGGFELITSRTLDGRTLLLEYRPAGAPPYVT
jgi:dihydrofolate reductase